MEPVALICRLVLAAVFLVMLRTYRGLLEAIERRDYDVFRGRVRLSRLRKLWLAAQVLTHSPAVFRLWIERDYCPGACRCRMEWLDQPEQPLRLSRHQPAAVRVRCHNTSIEPWRLHPSSNAGVQLNFMLLNDKDKRVAEGKAGLFHATVPPGDFIDLTVALPGLSEPGRYELRLDMEDAQHAYFLQTGSQPLVREVEVP